MRPCANTLIQPSGTPVSSAIVFNFKQAGRFFTSVNVLSRSFVVIMFQLSANCAQCGHCRESYRKVIEPARKCKHCPTQKNKVYWQLSAIRPATLERRKMSSSAEGYGVCRTVEDAKHIAAKGKQEGLRGCYPSAAVVLADALAKAEKELNELKKNA